MWQTLVGLAMVALTGGYFYWLARHRYKCPYCGRFVQWADINCRHCGNDMKFHHREGPTPPPRAARNFGPRRRRSDR